MTDLTKRLRSTSAIIPFAFLATSLYAAAAQETANTVDSAPTEQAYVLGRVTVTASKREEDILDAPYSISAVTGDDLKKIGATEYRDYLTTVPGVALVEAGIGSNNVIIRGLATAAGGSTLAGTVVTYFDEVALNDGTGAVEVEPVDIDRIEILRGPQGTYYGAGSIGGTLRVIPKRPQLNEYSADLAATVSSVNGADDLGSNLNATVNLPIVKGKAAIRGSVYQRDEPDYVDNLEVGNKTGGGTISGGRFAFLLEPTEQMDVLFQVISQSTEADGQRVREPFENSGNAQRRRGDEFGDTDFDLYNLNVGYDFDSVRLDSVTAYYETDFQGRRDASLFDGNVEALAGPPGLYGLDSYDLFADDTVKGDVFSQELRMASETDSAIQWLVGAFYRKETSDRVRLFTDDALLGQILEIDRNIDTTQWSGFAEANIDLPGAWGLDLGIRYSDYEQDVTVDAESGTQAEKVWTPRFNLRFEPSVDQLYYFQISKGYRLGGFNGAPPNLPGVDVPNEEQYYSYTSDSLWNYEIGTKQVFAGGRGNFSGAIFWADWTDIPIYLTLAGGAYTPLVNFGSATSKGVEAEFSYLLTEGLTASLNGSYVKTELEGTTGYKSQRLPASAETMFNLALSYEKPLQNGWQMYANGNVNYVGSYKSHLYEEFRDNVIANQLDTRFGVTEDKEVGGYTLVNARIGVQSDSWDLSVFAKNLFDDDTATLSNAFSYAGSPAESFVMPQTFGVSLKKSF
ncbi:TonB-dependent receptor [Hyphomonas oceanitis]|uniref:TonB-dependent receptor n=1 Tax=Hyphomonas oceanitis SCH89 TaxID=1280953 RepID=A0A059G3K3_9PROT|nr:TonB-dependent receptor [Hyphomonas oceanitis]KDA01412.1 TonB-dependent receptor [Hyphomonas oceanitis SCH89]